MSTNEKNNRDIDKGLLEFTLRLADDRLVLGHRLSELCGHGPILEEDIATTNTALDLIGQAKALYEYAAEIENGKQEIDVETNTPGDRYAYFRDVMDFKNILLVEQPNGDFASQMMRQFIFDAYDYSLMRRLVNSSDSTLAAVAGKAIKEATYHLRHSGQWVIKMGDGTEESAKRLKEAVDDLWMYSGELLENDEVYSRLSERGIAPHMSEIEEEWKGTIEKIFNEAKLEKPDPETFFMQSGGRGGTHSEELGHLLATMQSLARTYPKAEW
ncbi:MAG: phenylacetate-CoA oxygenase subunit PaaC [Candidatus Kapaibacteriales bacterium]